MEMKARLPVGYSLCQPLHKIDFFSGQLGFQSVDGLYKFSYSRMCYLCYNMLVISERFGISTVNGDVYCVFSKVTEKSN